MPSYRVKKRHSRNTVLELLDPLVAEWFSSRFSRLTEPQAYAVPLIHERKNVLVSSPTGSGKTLTAFLEIINELYRKQLDEGLEDRIYCLYVSPLKALANDIRRNLTKPLEEMQQLALEKGVPVPAIRTAVRSGDTPQSERSKMARKPPHILITTPESVSIILSSPKFVKSLEGLEYAIVDEIHELCNNKRGVLLSLSLERLEARTPGFTRIGLSATQAPIDDIAGFLAGFENGEQRDMGIVEAVERKRLDLQVLSPVEDITALPFEVVNERMYDTLFDLIQEHTTTLVFTNTRAGTEHVAYKLQERGMEGIAAHHGSLSKEIRLDVEERLKAGDLKCVVSSTSLELGIDIGSIDLVCQIGSPKSIAKGLQRIGRAGHSVGAVPTGRFIVFEPDDLVECAVLAKHAKEAHIDRVSIPEKSLDMLAQTIVGMSIDKRWDVDEAYNILKRAYPYRNMEKKEFISVVEYLGDRDSDLSFGRIWYDEEEETFGLKKGSRMIYYLNLGAIPDESSYMVFSKSGKRIGQLSEKFVERLAKGDIFVLGGQSYEFKRASGLRVFVDDAPGRKPTVPSWTGEMLPRSHDLSMAIGAFRREMLEKFEPKEHENDSSILSHIEDEYHVDSGSSMSISSYFKEQIHFHPRIPTDRRMVLEGYVDVRGRYNIVFHACCGRRVNDALSRAFAMAVSNKYRCSVSVSVSDDCFLLTMQRRIEPEKIADLVTSTNLESLLRSAVRGTELFRQRFRHCAGRSFMVLRNYRGRDISVGRQQSRSDRIMKALEDDEEHPVVVETFNEILNHTMDMPHAMKYLEMIEDGKVELEFLPFSNIPSPFAHNIVLAGISDIVLMEDRSTLLRELHRQVLEKIMPEEDVQAFQFSFDDVREYFLAKRPVLSTKEHILSALETLGPMNMTQYKGDNIFSYASDIDDAKEQASALIEEERVVSLWKRDLCWTLPSEAPHYTRLFKVGTKNPLALEAFRIISRSPCTQEELQYKLSKMSGAPLVEGEDKKKQVSEALRLLERCNMICRTGLKDNEYIYATRPESSISDLELETFVDKAIIRVLGLHGPLTVDEVAYRTGLPKDMVSAHLSHMESRDITASGYFVVGDDIQHMLASDLMKLRHGGDVCSRSEILQALWRKHTTPFASVKDLLRRYSSISRPYDLHPRCSPDVIEEWKHLRKTGEVIEGKFDNGRMSYILKEDVGLYAAVFRRRDPRGLEKEILGYIKGRDGTTLEDIRKKFPDARGIRDAVDFLESNIFLAKAYTGVDGWSKRSIYVSLDSLADEDWKGTREVAEKELLRRFIHAYGPVPHGILRFSGLSRSTIPRRLKELEKKGDILRVAAATGAGVQEYLFTPVDGVFLEQYSMPSGTIRIMSLYDPFVQPLWAEISAAYGERWVFPVFLDGSMIGAIEKWDMAGCHEIRDILLQDMSLLPEFVDAIVDEYDIHAAWGLDVLRVRSINGEAMDGWPPGSIKIFQDAGFKCIGDVMVLGPVSDRSFSEDTIIKYVLAKQHLGEHKLYDTLAMVKKHGGARRMEEITPRVQQAFPLRALQEESVTRLIKGIPDILLNSTSDQALQYQRARSKKLSPDMKRVYRVIREEGSLKRERILQLSPLSEGATLQAIKKLFSGAYIARNAYNEYVPLKVDKNPDKRRARKNLLMQLFKQFGVFSVPQLVGYMRGELRTGEVREILAELVEEDFLVKGFFYEGQEEILWMLSEDVERAEDIQATPTVVISSDDRLVYYLSDILSQRFGSRTGYIVIDNGEIIGLFKGKRTKNGVRIEDITGSERAEIIARQYAKSGEEQGIIEDEEWEIIDYVDKHIRGSARNRKT